MSARPSTDVPPAPPEPDAAPTASRSALKLALPVLVIFAILGGATLLLLGGSSKPTLPDNATASRTASFDGPVLSPLHAAPPLSTLHNYTGAPFDLAADRGKAVFVTFLYTHCPDVCPLIASNLHAAYDTMSRTLRRHVAIVAVSVDPHGDTPGTVAAFVHEHELTGEASYLIGSARQLGAVWEAWKVGSQRDAERPDLVSHSALIYGISAAGLLTTIYPANFRPTEVVHDAALLLKS